MRTGTQHLRRRDDERGAVLPFVGLLITVLVLMTSFAVDIGRIRLERRDLQAVADLAALDLSRRLEPTGAELADGVHREAPAAAVPRLEEALWTTVGPRNGFDATEANSDVKVGWWDESTRTTTVYDSGDTTVQPVNAAIVALDGVVDHLFQPGSTNVARVAAATLTKLIPVPPCGPGPCGSTTTGCVGPCVLGLAGNEVGSFLAAIDAGIPPTSPEASIDESCGRPAGLPTPGVLSVITLNCRLTATFRSGVTTPAGALRMSAVGYRGLADTSASLGELAALLTAGDVNRLLTTSVSRRDFLVAVATLAERGGASSASTPLTSFASSSTTDNDVRIGDLVGVAAGTPADAVATARFSLLGILLGSAQVIDGRNAVAPRVALGPVALGPLSVDVSLDAAVIQPPQLRFGPAAKDASGAWVTRAETAQVNARLNLAFDVAGVGRVSLPVTVAAAEAWSDLTGMRCSATPLGHRDDLLVTTRGVAAYLGQVADLRAVATPPIDGRVTTAGITPAAVATVSLGLSPLGVSLGTVTVNGASSAGVAGSPPRALPDLVPNDPTANFGSVSSPLDAGIGSQLASNLVLTPTGGVLDATVAQTVRNSIGLVLQDLDQGLLAPVLAALGFRIAGADARSPGSTCVPAP